MTDGVHILLVDDHEENLLALEAMLDRPEYCLHKAHSGKEALDLLGHHSFALMLLDARMPDLDGFDTARRVRENQQTRDLPIVFISAEYRDIAYLKKGYDLQAVDYLVKPIDMHILRAKVAVLVDLYQKTELIKKQAKRLQRSEQRLEKLVEKRTARLQEVNQQLQLEIEERKRAEVELRQAKDVAETANRSKSEFLANMRHELHTPLNAILGLSEMLAEGVAGPLTKQQLSYADDIRDSGVDLHGMINEMVSIANIDAKCDALVLAEHDLGLLVVDHVKRVQNRANMKQIKISHHVPDCLPQVVIDKDKIGHVLFNLLSNAIKFTPDGGAVGVDVECRESEVCVCVWDSGTGIAKEDQERIFDAFELAEVVLTKHHTGAGLGLAVAKQFVTLHRGKIWVDSDLEHGSRFYFSLPIPPTVCTL